MATNITTNYSCRNHVTEAAVKAGLCEQCYGQAVNKAIAELCGYYMYHYDKDFEKNCYYMLSVPNDCFWAGHDQERFRHEWGQWHAGERKTEQEAWLDAPDYYHSTDAVFPVGYEKLKLGKLMRAVESGNGDPQSIAAAICEAILQSRGIMIGESEGAT